MINFYILKKKDLHNFKYLLQQQFIQQKNKKTKSARNTINYTFLNALTTIANLIMQKYFQNFQQLHLCLRKTEIVQILSKGIPPTKVVHPTYTSCASNLHKLCIPTYTSCASHLHKLCIPPIQVMHPTYTSCASNLQKLCIPPTQFMHPPYTSYASHLQKLCIQPTKVVHQRSLWQNSCFI